MKFIVTDDVFEKAENLCFGAVVARGVDNSKPIGAISELLAAAIAGAEAKCKDKNVKEMAEILCYRETFQLFGINPNKFMASIEALVSRIAKGKGFPSISPIVDLGNAVSLNHFIPLGAHDMDSAAGDISVRLSKKGDTFTPFGETSPEILEDGELVYSAGNIIKTRRWIWRQSEEGKITDQSKNIFFPLDGFTDKNKEEVLAAQNELAELLPKFFDCEIKTGFIDKDHRQFEF